MSRSFETRISQVAERFRFSDGAVAAAALSKFIGSVKRRGQQVLFETGAQEVEVSRYTFGNSGVSISALDLVGLQVHSPLVLGNVFFPVGEARVGEYGPSTYFGDSEFVIRAAALGQSLQAGSRLSVVDSLTVRDLRLETTEAVL